MYHTFTLFFSRKNVVKNGLLIRCPPRADAKMKKFYL